MSDRNTTWRPNATIETLKARAQFLQCIRDFFAGKNILEVETPILAATTVPDVYIDSLQTTSGGYLQTSPEFHMKRLLAAGSGAIFQLTKAFRANESGRLHKCEFTMLEWYRPGFDHHQLMNEMDELLQHLLMTPKAERKTYAEIFNEYCAINPHTATAVDLQQCAARFAINAIPGLDITDKNAWLDVLMSHVIEPNLGFAGPIFIYDYPASQAALAKLRKAENKDYAVAERFEVYIQGIELANGFHELCDPTQQRARFIADIAKRQALQLAEISLDEDLLAALDAGLPPCAGVALGVDRLFMLKQGERYIHKVMSF